MKKWGGFLVLSLIFIFLFGKTITFAETKAQGHPLNGCSSCHVPHGAKGDRLWPFAPDLQTKSGTELTEVTALCYSCHDGTITSKGKHFFEQDETTHPVGIKPSDRINIPDNFSLDSEGRMTCSTCHNPHNSNVRNYLRVPNKNGQLCISCHKNKG